MRRAQGFVLVLSLLLSACQRQPDRAVPAKTVAAPPPISAEPEADASLPSATMAPPLERLAKSETGVPQPVPDSDARVPPSRLPPSPSPLGWSGVVMRLEFAYTDRIFLGTGFIVRDRAGEDWLMTCAHLIGEKAWENRYRVKMRTMRGDRIVESFGSTLHVGTPVNIREARPDRWPDMTKDLVIRSVSGTWTFPLPLAKKDPVVGEWVWAVGCEARKPPTPEKLFLGQVVEVERGGFAFRKQLPFDPRGFSGGPVLNARGEVVGNVLAGRQDLVSGATVSVLREQLKANGVRVD